jgi:hypothetical protein
MKWLAIIAVWAMLGVIYAGQIYFEVRSQKGRADRDS